jgi:hypothetical protein
MHFTSAKGQRTSTIKEFVAMTKTKQSRKNQTEQNCFKPSHTGLCNFVRSLHNILCSITNNSIRGFVTMALLQKDGKSIAKWINRFPGVTDG